MKSMQLRNPQKSSNFRKLYAIRYLVATSSPADLGSCSFDISLWRFLSFLIDITMLSAVRSLSTKATKVRKKSMAKEKNEPKVRANTKSPRENGLNFIE